MCLISIDKIVRLRPKEKGSTDFLEVCGDLTLVQPHLMSSTYLEPVIT